MPAPIQPTGEEELANRLNDIRIGFQEYEGAHGHYINQYNQDKWSTFVTQQLIDFINQEVLHALDRIETSSELKHYLRNEGFDDANAQECGEVGVAREVTDAIQAERSRYEGER